MLSAGDNRPVNKWRYWTSFFFQRGQCVGGASRRITKADTRPSIGVGRYCWRLMSRIDTLTSKHNRIIRFQTHTYEINYWTHCSTHQGSATAWDRFYWLDRGLHSIYFHGMMTINNWTESCFFMHAINVWKCCFERLWIWVVWRKRNIISYY